MNPQVSVIIPNYNHARFLSRRIESVLQQTYTNFEVIILDDGSTDHSRDIILQYAGMDNRIRYYFNETNSGNTFKQWNIGIRLAKGQYIWIAESDDYAHPEFLATMQHILNEHPTVGLAFCKMWVIDEHDQIVTEKGVSCVPNESLLPRFASDYFNRGTEEVTEYLFAKNYIYNASAVLFRKAVYEQAGYADESLRLGGDLMMWVKMLRFSDIYYCATPLNYFRTHVNNVRTAISKTEELRGVMKIYQYVMAHFELTQQKRNKMADRLFFMWKRLKLVYGGHTNLADTFKLMLLLMRLQKEFLLHFLKFQFSAFFS
jgi:glycosyltransferase involved in cell wall biosynthesis